ncbi:MAG: hypothetical protein A2074_05325 [Candidatus Aquicultor primus]|uniref:Uncharacterized protein n=1 Tax=Candidatus Aquicultor primus TaxID=1797195 RepID=A0A1F2UP51_9ACTN|nr:MAG: hypothetical protein A2074_05325 [Candidatus Aquicultor primus]
MDKSKKEQQSKEKLFSDADEKIWQELKRKTAERARSLGIISEADIERIITEVRQQNMQESNSNQK